MEVVGGVVCNHPTNHLHTTTMRRCAARNNLRVA